MAWMPAVGDAVLPNSRNKISAKDRNYFRDLLLKRRALIAGDVDHMHNNTLSHSSSEAAGDLSRMPYHMADVGTDNFEHEFMLGLIQNEEDELRRIDEALDRLKEGSYGLCSCGKPIPKARLRALPYASLCIECQRNEETGGS